MSRASFTLDHPAFADRTGVGVRVAVVDSGIHTANPHVSAIAGGVHIGATGQDDDIIDRLGHGTAVAAAILEKAPGIDLIVVRVFEDTLATSTGVLSRAIEWAADSGCRLINLSLGTTNPDREAGLQSAIDHAALRGALVVSAREQAGLRWLPGSLTGAASVLLDPECARDELGLELNAQGTPIFHASGLPRPVPGVPPERNVSGISFAVANTTGFLARLLQSQLQLRSLGEIAVHLGS